MDTPSLLILLGLANIKKKKLENDNASAKINKELRKKYKSLNVNKSTKKIIAKE